MIYGKKVVVVMPAYNAAKTLAQTQSEIDRSIVDEIILVDDGSKDNTKELAHGLGIQTIVHTRNLGYGGNQKTCYIAALNAGAEIVIMLHPDYQYTPKLLPAMAHMIASEQYDAVLASRILGAGALAGGMPLYKYIFNRCLTLFQNLCLGQKLSEYHTGYRGFSRKVLETLPLGECNDDFVFDNEMIGQMFAARFRIGEISCPTKYFDEASSISFKRSCKYGLGVLRVSLLYLANRWGLSRAQIFNPAGKKLRDLPARAVSFQEYIETKGA
jgi:glycosyltransferase involved in cell wall biosynthesis